MGKIRPGYAHIKDTFSLDVRGRRISPNFPACCPRGQTWGRVLLVWAHKHWRGMKSKMPTAARGEVWQADSQRVVTFRSDYIHTSTRQEWGGGMSRGPGAARTVIWSQGREGGMDLLMLWRIITRTSVFQLSRALGENVSAVANTLLSLVRSESSKPCGREVL